MVRKATATQPSDSRFPSTATYSRQYAAGESATGSYAEFEVTKLANETLKYKSEHFFAGQVSSWHLPPVQCSFPGVGSPTQSPNNPLTIECVHDSTEESSGHHSTSR